MNIGNCNRCGKEAELIQVYDDEEICAECLDSDFQQCDICGQFWEIGFVEVELDDQDRFVCEYCAEEMDED